MSFFSRNKPRTFTVHAFSSPHPGLAEELLTTVEVSQSFNPNVRDLNPPPSKVYKALWDTGATGSGISVKVVNELGLSIIGKSIVSHVQGEAISSRYLVNIILPNNIGASEVGVTEAILDKDIDVLIGMDIITLGDFTISNNGGRTHFTFRTPSCERICFIQQGEQKQALRPANTNNTPSGPSRNLPCPCGSGRKYKKCCGAFQQLK